MFSFEEVETRLAAKERNVRPTVFIHTNHKQIVGAVVAEHSMRRNSNNADKFDVRIIDTKDYPALRAREGQPYLRDGVKRTWRYDDLQSFTTLRFMPPELMGYQGRAVVVDPDVFAVGDVWELLDRDMEGAALMCRPRTGARHKRGHSSVMLLDCAKLTHWKWEAQFNDMFAFTRDYMDWMGLKLEPKSSIGYLENEWNDLDKLTSQTKMIHNTHRRTQPWKAGLPIDFHPPENPMGFWPSAGSTACGDGSWATTRCSATTARIRIASRSSSSSACSGNAWSRAWSRKR